MLHPARSAAVFSLRKKSPAVQNGKVGSTQSDIGGEFAGPAGRPSSAPLAGSNFSADADGADRLTREQMDNSEFATNIKVRESHDFECSLVAKGRVFAM